MAIRQKYLVCKTTRDEIALEIVKSLVQRDTEEFYREDVDAVIDRAYLWADALMYRINNDNGHPTEAIYRSVPVTCPVCLAADVEAKLDTAKVNR